MMVESSFLVGIMHYVRWVAIAVLAASPARPQDATVRAAPASYRPMTAGERWNLYARSTFRNPMIPFRLAAGAGISQWSDEPTEWGQGGEGFGKRVAHRFGRLVVQESFEASTAALLGHDARYTPSAETRVAVRTSHALTASFVTLDRHGNRVFRASRLGGILAAQLVSRSWMPDRYRSAGSISSSVGIQLGISTAFNLFREFTPDIKRALRRK
jgi:hypothetical protein